MGWQLRKSAVSTSCLSLAERMRGGRLAATRTTTTNISDGNLFGDAPKSPRAQPSRRGEEEGGAFYGVSSPRLVGNTLSTPAGQIGGGWPRFWVARHSWKRVAAPTSRSKAQLVGLAGLAPAPKCEQQRRRAVEGQFEAARWLSSGSEACRACESRWVRRRGRMAERRRSAEKSSEAPGKLPR